MRAAMYMLYGPMTVLTLTVKEGVHMFALDNKKEYKMIKKDVKIGDKALYGSGALQKDWLPAHKKFIGELIDNGFKLRYSGSFVADVHQFLKYGGVFSYPLFKDHMGGKLRRQPSTTATISPPGSSRSGTNCACCLRQIRWAS